jgi:hypothetical protein
VEYGDLDTMGVSTADGPFHFNAVYKEFLGCLQPQMVATTGTYQIGPYETVAQAPKVVPLQADDVLY